jgi:hypothetical protein
MGWLCMLCHGTHVARCHDGTTCALYLLTEYYPAVQLPEVHMCLHVHVHCQCVHKMCLPIWQMLSEVCSDMLGTLLSPLLPMLLGCWS